MPLALTSIVDTNGGGHGRMIVDAKKVGV
jgi:hypothetical protein